MKGKQVTYGDLLLFISDKTVSAGYGDDRYWGLFGVPGRVQEVLANWVSSSNSRTGRAAVRGWAVEYVSSLVHGEGNAVTRSQALQAFRRPINESFAGSFKFTQLYDNLYKLCPHTLALLVAFSTTTRQAKKLNCSPCHLAFPQLIGSAMTILLRARSQRNSYAAQIMGLYLYATGSSRQVISVMSHVGLSSSYQMLAGTRRRSSRPTGTGEVERTPSTTGRPRPRVGILDTLSDSCRTELRTRAQSPRQPGDDSLGNVYDNINFMFRAAEQILGRTDSQENGTCATAFSLYKAPREYMRTADLVRSFSSAPPLTFKDIRLTQDETKAMRDHLIWTVMNITVQHGGPSFQRYREQLTAVAPSSTHRIPLHKTTVFPMPSMEIDESSTLGNVKVLDTMFTEMGHDVRSPEFNETIKIVFGDQLSMARVRAVTNTRVGHGDASQSYLNVVFAPGFFHYQMAATHGVLETHWGDPSLSARDPGSLSFHNSVLQRKPIVLSSLPPYRTCRDLTFVSLYARVLHCLELVSGHNIADYPAQSSFEQFQAHIAAVVDKYANPAQAVSLHDGSQPQRSAQDPVLHNAILFFRDALILRHFADAIKSGSSDHLVTVLKLWALGFRAMGRVKYAHELLHLVHNLTYVWPRELREIIMNNWLVNTTGNADGFIPVDLLQEHLNFSIKVIYKAHGSNASWEWLETISPCIEVLRRLARQISAELGAKQGVKHHSPDLSKDVHELMASLRKHSVYVAESRRPDGDSIKLVPNVYSAGIHALAGPLAEYNTTFIKMQDRRRMKPMVGSSALDTFGVARRAQSFSFSEPESPSASGTPPGRLAAEFRSTSPSSESSSSSTESSDTSDPENGAAAGNDETAGNAFGDTFFTLDSAEDVDLDMDGF
ncbi:hypothetical protein C2E23DRAFT_741772 [Lenzites betulinus]|nr:hypothetical protein C2E23DRAFT_741772 [Lenzites betulinus]